MTSDWKCLDDTLLGLAGIYLTCYLQFKIKIFMGWCIESIHAVVPRGLTLKKNLDLGLIFGYLESKERLDSK